MTILESELIDMSLIIRQYTRADQDHIVKLHIDGLNQFGASIGDPALDKDIEQIEETYINNKGEFLVGLQDNKVICMGAFKKIDDEIAEIKRIRIDREYQGRGIGGFLLSALEKSARAKGYKRVILDTTSRQVPAQKLFSRNGYKETVKRQYKEMELIYYTKTLEEL